MTVAPFLLVLVLCLFWLVSSMLHKRAPVRDKRLGGPHASWRVSEVAAPLRRFWHVTRDKTGNT